MSEDKETQIPLESGFKISKFEGNFTVSEFTPLVAHFHGCNNLKDISTETGLAMTVSYRT
jgi:hypothetical protein